MNAWVRRISVDEQLADDLIRLVICSLTKGIEVFTDRDEDWGMEREVLVKPKTYARRLGVRSSSAPPWETLEEGQVFVSGEFEVVGDRRAPRYFKVSHGRREFLRIDDLEGFKEDVKWIYSELLKRG